MTPQQMKWDSERVQRFWDYVSLRANQDNYFSFQVGCAILNLLAEFVSFESKKVLDYGAGPGHLLPYLEQRGSFFGAVDFSIDSVALLEDKFSRSPRWLGGKASKGANIPFPDESFDIVLCLETIEHILDEHLTSTFREINRVLVPNGIVLFTTPSNERLADSMVYCANCNTEFHRWQHLRSWSESVLTAEIEKNGFCKLFCESVNVKHFMQLPPVHFSEWSAGYCYSKIKRMCSRALDLLQHKDFASSRILRQWLNAKRKPNLVGIFRKVKFN